MGDINEKTLEYIAMLAKIDLKNEEKESLLEDVKEILNYFRQLQEVNTDGVQPMNGGTALRNVFRNDNQTNEALASYTDLREAMPEEENGYLKIPKVFEDKEEQL